MTKEKLSVIIITYNEESDIEDCLKSVSWADEIILVDSFSTDRTVEIAEKFGCKIFQHKWEGYAVQKRFALDNTLNEWILSLDADERVTDQLKSSIDNILQNGSLFNGYKIARRNHFLGKWIKGAFWYPDYQLRFFRKRNTKIEIVPIHEGFEIEGETGIIEGDIIHYSYKNIFDAIKKVNRYSTLMADIKKNKKVNVYDFFLRPRAAFYADFISRKGYKDGIYGVLVATLNAITNLMTYLKIWELQHKPQKKNNHTE